MKKVTPEELEKHRQRELDIASKIKEKESLGGEHLNEDIEEDPPAKELLPEDVDYLYKKPSRKIKAFIARQFEKKLFKSEFKKHHLKVSGEENLASLKGGAVITGNHFHFFESVNAIYIAKYLRKYKKYYKVIKEGNYQLPGLFGFLMRNTHTLPLSSNMKTMINFNKAVKELLKDGALILVYPEQSMWWNYTKPRPHKEGAAHLAYKNNVPLVSYFVTMEDSSDKDEYGDAVKNYTLHILPPIFPDITKPMKEEVSSMTLKNYNMWKEVYETTYHKKLEY